MEKTDLCLLRPCVCESLVWTLKAQPHGRVCLAFFPFVDSAVEAVLSELILYAAAPYFVSILIVIGQLKLQILLTELTCIGCF
jgi:hypothetical protein